ncbi:uncharacterized protein OCT59_006782 [Rhizophagus irregularis]|uniref:Uncharacterized protein n=1 Tax=Rhizophagus irregularis TaxID=588596 RepID=A0A916EHI8_9GLOM|nr:hypothetical protein OCT59_006782 [Rhizophagus irregularis]CAB4474268.1 unnamed protein product [Rhizophagus irregularis]CAB5210428.1 unnamed protein product [Rhizophagus irregularis]CAB5388828.1 unnamed protein product [Rhizophagus irregularis]
MILLQEHFPYSITYTCSFTCTISILQLEQDISKQMKGIESGSIQNSLIEKHREHTNEKPIGKLVIVSESCVSPSPLQSDTHL